MSPKIKKILKKVQVIPYLNDWLHNNKKKSLAASEVREQTTAWTSVQTLWDMISYGSYHVFVASGSSEVREPKCQKYQVKKKENAFAQFVQQNGITTSCFNVKLFCTTVSHIKWLSNHTFCHQLSCHRQPLPKVCQTSFTWNPTIFCSIWVLSRLSCCFAFYHIWIYLSKNYNRYMKGRLTSGDFCRIS